MNLAYLIQPAPGNRPKAGPAKSLLQTPAPKQGAGLTLYTSPLPSISIRYYRRYERSSHDQGQDIKLTPPALPRALPGSHSFVSVDRSARGRWFLAPLCPSLPSWIRFVEGRRRQACRCVHGCDEGMAVCLSRKLFVVVVPSFPIPLRRFPSSFSTGRPRTSKRKRWYFRGNERNRTGLTPSQTMYEVLRERQVKAPKKDGTNM